MRGIKVNEKRQLAYELFNQGKTTDEVERLVHVCKASSHKYYKDWCTKRIAEKQEIRQKKKTQRYCGSGVIFYKCTTSFWHES